MRRFASRARVWLQGLIAPALFWLGRLHLPFAVRRVSQTDVERALAVLEPGDVILTAERGAPTNLVIPGVFTHATIYAPSSPLGKAEVVEAVGAGVRVTGIWDLLLGCKDRFAVLRSREATYSQRCAAAARARELVGRPYDIRLMLADDFGKAGDAEIYCGEAPIVAFRQAVGRAFTFRGARKLGDWIASPMDYFEDRERWELVFDSKGEAS